MVTTKIQPDGSRLYHGRITSTLSNSESEYTPCSTLIFYSNCTVMDMA